MAEKVEYPKNDQCPCGSGKKYKNCCLNKGIDYRIDHGVVYQSIKMDSEVTSAVKRQREKLIATFGREPADDDLLFFDLPDKEEEIIERTAEIMKGIGTDPALIYAFKKTGMLVTESNIDKISDIRLREWEDAINEYNELH